MRRSLRIQAWWLIAPTVWACGGTPVGPDDNGNGNGNGDPVPARVALVVPPAQAQTGRPFFAQPVVQIQDSAGNAIAAAGVPVSAALASGPAGASLGGTTTVTSGAEGRAAFANLQLAGTAGVYTLRFESTGLTAAASGPLALLPANPLIPMTELAPFTYYGYEGGLYPGASNTMPSRHDSVGRARARAVVPRLANGTPNPGGKYVIMSMGMSNTTMEWCTAGGLPCNGWTFTGQTAADAAVNVTTLAIVNGAMGGQTAAFWDQPSDLNYDRVRDDVLGPQGLSEAQVQVLWLKVANPNPATGPGAGSMPAIGSDADSLVMRMGAIVRAAKTRYPNLQIVFASSRIYAGYANITLNPEPYAFEYGFSVKWLVGAQITQMSGGPQDARAGDLNYDTMAPWIAWGPYLWANGLTPRADGLVWERADLAADGTHPSTPTGQQKVGTMLLTFFKTSPYSACWFLAGQNCP
jgi:hypothetical protein